MDADVVVWVVLGVTVALLVFVILAPWRSLRRDAIAEEEYLAVLAGEAEPERPFEEAEADAEGDDR